MRILVVEGNNTIRRILSQQMQDAGLVCIAMESGSQAYKALQSENFDFICVSLHFNDMVASAFIERVRSLAAYVHVPIVLFTSEHATELLTDALKAGATDVYQRDEFEELITFIKRYNLRYSKLDGRVLYVEDSRTQQQTTRLMLESVGLTVDCVLSAEEGWERFQNFNYDLLIVDVVLAGDMSGIRLVSNIRRSCGAQGDVPILAVSAYDEPSRRIELLNRGANDYVSKPLIQDELIARVRGLIGQRQLLTQLQLQSQQAIARAEVTDAVTQLPNRRFLLQQLEQEIARADRHGCYSGLLYLDIDQFKGINDSLGQQAGDQLLREVGRRLRAVKRREDTLVALGGDDFALLVSEASNLRDHAVDFVRNRAHEIQLVLKPIFEYNGKTLRLSATIGIALFPVQHTSAFDVLKQAETALYRAKEISAANVAFFSRDMQVTAEERFALHHALIGALERNELYLCFQPILDLQRRLVAVEALLRWRRQEQVVSPAVFIPVAEETGLIHPIGTWVVVQCCRQMRVWQQQGLPAGFQRIAINVSAHQFRRDHFAQRMLDVIAAEGARPDWFTFEITESLLIEQVDKIIVQLNQLRAAGIEIAIDDFGTGYSSLSYLKQLPLQQLKIDRSFVQDMLVDQQSDAIVDTILAMAKALSLQVVAEGVETEAQYQHLCQKGCEQVQGFFFYRPMPAEDLSREFMTGASDPAIKRKR